MRFSVKFQDSFSRGLLILRTLLGWLYIAIPQAFLMFFVGIWACILAFLAFWVVLVTGKYPESWFNFQVKFINWSSRVNASLLNLTDEYPAFLPRGESAAVSFTAERPAKISRGMTLVRALFGIIFIGIPHGFCLFFRNIGTAVLALLAWFAVLFTGKYPEKWHAFNVGSFRWGNRVALYWGNMTDVYPPFSGKE
ncbi:MAG: DUF4389 domain-containing protein [Rectinemataceae bacterium]